MGQAAPSPFTKKSVALWWNDPPNGPSISLAPCRFPFLAAGAVPFWRATMRLVESLVVVAVAACGILASGCVVHAYTGTDPNAPNAGAPAPAPAAGPSVHDRIQHIQ